MRSTQTASGRAREDLIKHLVEKQLPYFLTLFILASFLSACEASHNSTPVFHADSNPKHLSDWNIIGLESRQLHLNDSVVAYDLNSSLFTDYAHKLRTIWMPDGTSAVYNSTDTFDFPVGTIISKTFYYPLADGSGSVEMVLQTSDQTSQLLLDGFDLNKVKLIETRLLVHRESGWDALPYVWNTEQNEAILKRTGDIQSLTLQSGNSNQEFAYVVPNANQCAGCHATNASTRKIQPIGPKARHLNKNVVYKEGAANQLQIWAARGLLKNLPNNPALIPQNAVWDDLTQSLDSRARAYLDINCSHCHNKVGPADTSGLLLEPDSPDGPSLGLCKLPIAAGTGTGDREYGIVPGKPDESIFVYRMNSINPAEMMPELGRSTAHTEGVELIAQWIAEMQGDCDTQ